jgi:hypothetical protein
LFVRFQAHASLSPLFEFLSSISNATAAKINKDGKELAETKDNASLPMTTTAAIVDRRSSTERFAANWQAVARDERGAVERRRRTAAGDW